MGATCSERGELSHARRGSVMGMNPIRLLVDSFADAGLPNAQMGNAREIVARLNPDIFHVTMFKLGAPDQRIAARKNTRLIQLPLHKQTVRILSEFLWGRHQLLFYMKVSPSSRCYQALRRRWRDRRITIGTIEGECNLRDLPDLNSERIRFWEETILRCDHLYSNSQFVQRSLKTEYGLHSDVVPTGADTHFYTPRWDRSPNLRPRVLFVGTITPRKQPQLLMSAAARFPQADFRIAGDGPLRKLLAMRIKREGLTNVNLTGPLNAEQLRNEYQHADVFLFPSSSEGSPKVVVEAAACGLPVIVRNSYAAETVIHGVTGFQAANDEEIFSFLSLLLSRPDLRRQFGEAGRRLSTNFDWGPITAQWEDVFLELAQGRRLGRAS